MLRTILLCAALGLTPALGHAQKPPAAAEAMSDAETLAALKLEAAVRDAYLRYFQGLGLPIPELATHVRVSLEAGSTDKVASAHIDSHLTAASSPPDQIIREARQAVVRRLAELGYEINGQEAATASDATLAPSLAPRATLLIDVVTPEEPKGLADRLVLGPILIVAAMALSALLCALAALFMLRRLQRSLRGPKQALASHAQDKSATRPQPVVEAPSLWHEPTCAPSAAAASHLAPSMALGAEPAKLSEAVPATAGEPAVLPPLAKAHGLALKAADGELPPLPPVFETFERLAFDEAVRAFSAFDAEMRTAIFERLGIKPSVRSRIEQELAQISAT